MKKLFISSDIEGTCGIVSWDETEKEKADYADFSDQMTREAAAACEGALDAGFDQIVVRDAHDSGRNLNARKLPEGVQVIRGWGEEPLSMMSGLDESFSAAVFTGYHDAAGNGGNPLSHTLSTGMVWLKVNGQPASEGVINAYTAALFHVPVAVVTGDEGICGGIRNLIPACRAVPVTRGFGGGSISIHPDLAVKHIRETVKQALTSSLEGCLLKLPEHFDIELRYTQHPRAFKAGFYPGVTRLDSHTLVFRSDDWYEVLRMIHFCV